jgi:pimeloyl-ACP methyl ester carboxylesterase
MENMQHLFFQNLGCEIHYWYRKGSENKWILFFHGAGLDHAMFESQLGLFDSTYHIIAWDARGHGLSKLEPGKRFRFADMIDDCKKLYERYPIDRAILIGQSMGGNLAQEIAYYSPELVEKLVLIDCTKNTGKLTRIEKMTLKSSRFLFACCPWKMLISQSAKTSANTDSVRDYISGCFNKLDKQTFVDIMIDMIGSCLHEDAGYRFRQPVLLLCGADDKLGNIRKIAEPWAKEDSNITFHMVEHAGHNSNQDQPELVNRRIHDFINKNQGARAANSVRRTPPSAAL